jgi:pre-mRNA-processing factor 17
MDLLQDYSSDDDEQQDSSAMPIAKRPNREYLQSAPAVSMLARAESTALTIVNHEGSSSDSAMRQGDTLLMNNPKKQILYQPAYGPSLDDLQTASKGKAVFVEENVAFDESTFHEQRAAFQRSGKAVDPDGSEILRTTLGYDSHRLELFAKKEQDRRKRPRPEPSRKRTALHLDNDDDDEQQYGIWAPPSKEELWAQENSLSCIQKGEPLADEQIAERAYIAERNRQRGQEESEQQEVSAFERMVERKMAHLLPPRLNNETNTPVAATSTFHGTSEVDYKGDSWMAPPAGLGSVVTAGDLGTDHHKCFVPKRCVHRFTGHNQGVHRIRLFPRTGHLLLSAGLDGKCKVWSTIDKQVMRTYLGHSAGVRDVQFNSDGSRFVSASFDRYLRLWNTATGNVEQTFTNRKVPYCVQFYPHDDNLFVVGCSDNKIVTYDATTAEITQEYNHHLAPVNAILFVEDQGTKMVTSGDDKKILVWEWDIGVPIKYITDPTMHSMPCLVMHPAQQYFCGQSLDNTITVFQAGKRYALQRKKKFSGHVTSGYACEMTFSADGQFLISGDGNGAVFIWDWKRHKVLQKYKAHDSGPAICCAWHPLDASTMFTCGWDGVIKMWQ